MLYRETRRNKIEEFIPDQPTVETEKSVEKVDRVERFTTERNRIETEYNEQAYQPEAHLKIGNLVECMCGPDGQLDPEKLAEFNAQLQSKRISLRPDLESFQHYAKHNRKLAKLLAAQPSGRELLARITSDVFQQDLEAVSAQDPETGLSTVEANNLVDRVEAFKDRLRGMDISLELKQKLYYAMIEYASEFDLPHRVEVLERANDLVLTLNIHAMEQLQMFEGSQGKELLQHLESEYKTSNPTLWVSLPKNGDQRPQEVLEKMPQAMEGAVFMYTGWYSTPEEWFKQDICQPTQAGENPTTLVEEMHEAYQRTHEGADCAMIGMAGRGCIDHHGRGSRAVRESLAGMSYSYEENKKYTEDTMSKLGVKPTLFIGHSRAGREAQYVPEQMVGVPSHGLNPAALLKTDWELSGQALHRMATKGVFRFLQLTNHETVAHLAGRLSHIRFDRLVNRLSPQLGRAIGSTRINDMFSLIADMVGNPQGADYKAIQDNYSEIKRVSDADTAEPNFKAMLEMAKGAGRHGETNRDPLEQTALATVSSGQIDFFVNTHDLEARLTATHEALYADQLEDFGVQELVSHLDGNDYEGRGGKPPGEVLHNLFEARELLDPGEDLGGHLNFYDERIRGKLFERIFESSESQKFTPDDFDLAALISAGEPILLRVDPQLGESQMPAILKDKEAWLNQSHKQALELVVSPVTYEKVRVLRERIDEQPRQSTWDSYRENARDQVIEQMDAVKLEKVVESVSLGQLENFLHTRPIDPNSREYVAWQKFTQSLELGKLSANGHESDKSELQSVLKNFHSWMGRLKQPKGEQVDRIVEQSLRAVAIDQGLEFDQGKFNAFLVSLKTGRKVRPGEVVPIKEIKLGSSPTQVIENLKLYAGQFFINDLFEKEKVNLYLRDQEEMVSQARQIIAEIDPYIDGRRPDFFHVDQKGDVHAPWLVSLRERLLQQKNTTFERMSRAERNRFYQAVWEFRNSEVTTLDPREDHQKPSWL